LQKIDTAVKRFNQKCKLFLSGLSFPFENSSDNSLLILSDGSILFLFIGVVSFLLFNFKMWKFYFTKLSVTAPFFFILFTGNL